jgi:hypothetical protein
MDDIISDIKSLDKVLFSGDLDVLTNQLFIPGAFLISKCSTYATKLRRAPAPPPNYHQQQQRTPMYAPSSQPQQQHGMYAPTQHVPTMNGAMDTAAHAQQQQWKTPLVNGDATADGGACVPGDVNGGSYSRSPAHSNASNHSPWNQSPNSQPDRANQLKRKLSSTSLIQQPMSHTSIVSEGNIAQQQQAGQPSVTSGCNTTINANNALDDIDLDAVHDFIMDDASALTNYTNNNYHLSTGTTAAAQDVASMKRPHADLMMSDAAAVGANALTSAPTGTNQPA